MGRVQKKRMGKWGHLKYGKAKQVSSFDLTGVRHIAD
jgi:hypothetical protein